MTASGPFTVRKENELANRNDRTGGDSPTRVILRDRRRIYSGRSFSFEVEDLDLPNGVRTEMAGIRHPGSTGIVPIFEDGRVAMIRQYRPFLRRKFLEIPAGTMEPGESPEECARRELLEETGWTARRWDSLGAVHLVPAYSDEVIHLFLARKLTRSVRQPDSDEIIEDAVRSFGELMALIDSGALTDALTVLALQRAWFFLNRGDAHAREL